MKTMTFKLDLTVPLLVFFRNPETAFALWTLAGQLAR